MIDNKPRILFVDDDELILEAIRRVILRHRRDEWDMYFESLPIKALHLQEQKPFDVVITDLQMPEMNGLELAKSLHDINPSTEIVMLSGTADLGSAVEVINSTKIFRFYTKPCPPETLESGIEECLAHGLKKQRSETNIGIDILNRLPIGVIVCTEDSHVIHTNQFGAEICAEKDGLCIDKQGFLRTTQANQREPLAQALSHAGDLTLQETALSIDRMENETPLSVIISSMNKEQKLVLISAPEKHLAPSPGTLQAMYKMPLSEAKLLHLIVSGFQLKTAAHELKITEGSARTYLKRVFSRTNTNSQPELVRTILLTPGVYGT
ncbi:MAG: response regulator [Alphaproteobacteria bacterium]|nr:response regulator [Rhodospirillales bacterium]MCW9045857.1 response regulator [Alphaproteobacteria bacterium]